MKLNTSTVTKFLFLFCTLLYVAETVAQKSTRPWDIGRYKKKYYDFVNIKSTSGQQTIGTDSDPYGIKDAPKKVVSINQFKIQEREVSNLQYKRFVKYVRDSIIRTKLARLAYDLNLNQEDGGIGTYAFLELDTLDNASQRYYYENYLLFSDDIYAGRKINWDVDLEWEPNRYPDNWYAEVMDSVFLNTYETFNGKKMFDTKQLKYKYTWFDSKSAIKNPKQNPKDFVREEIVSIYPDTTVWMKDFEYAANDHMSQNYFWHPEYHNFPVVGVNYEQARAYCHFLTYSADLNYNRIGKPVDPPMRLPTEAEWEYAAKFYLEGELSDRIYPWEGDELFDRKGDYRANFKPDGGYGADGVIFTTEVDNNKFRRTNKRRDLPIHMAGNVAEWTSSTYNMDSYTFTSPLNPDYINRDNPIKTVKGGSWKDIAYFMRTSTRDYEHKDSARSYIGFRVARDFISEKNSDKY